jgi:predicted CXXCH cytochrome family protein
VNAACIACHPEQKDGTHVSSMAKQHPVGGNLNDPKRDGHDFSCASCHNAHGSDNPNFFYYGDTAMESCAWCHGDKSGQRPELKDVVSRARRAAPSTGAAGAGSPGAGSPGAGSPGAGSPGAGSGGGVGDTDQPFNGIGGTLQ